jgi:large subunit ribosomal protein L10
MAKVGRLVKDIMVRDVEAALQQQPTFFVTSLGPLPAVETDGLRKRLAGAQARMLVVKRTLGLRGVSALAGDGASALFSGSIALVLPSDQDVLPTAKVLVEFAKANQEKFTVRGGFVEGQLLNAKRVEELAGLPGRPQLMAQVVGALEAPISDLIFTIERLIGDIAWIVEEAAKKQLAPPAGV